MRGGIGWRKVVQEPVIALNCTSGEQRIAWPLFRFHVNSNIDAACDISPLTIKNHMAARF